MRTPVILNGRSQRTYATQLVNEAEPGSIVTIAKPSRSTAQNKKLWAMLGDIARCAPEGLQWTQDTWKAAFMSYCGHQVQFCHGIDGGQPFPIGFRSSHLNVAQCAELITCIQEYGDRHGVDWTDTRKGGWLQEPTNA